MTQINRREFLRGLAWLVAVLPLRELGRVRALSSRKKRVWSDGPARETDLGEWAELLRALGKHEGLTVYQESPFNAGSPLAPLRAAFETPNELFFARNHAPVPEIAAAEWCLKVDGLVARPLRLSLADLSRDFPTVELAATLQCAGNRRREMLPDADPGSAVLWGSDAISHGRWTGVRLRDVLRAAGVQEGARFVAALGRDEIQKGGRVFGMGGSIPLAKALGEEVLLATGLNGAPLPPLHGGPLRLLVPGYIGARSIKWLGQITLQEEPSENHYQQRAYKVFPPEITSETVDWAQGEMLGPFRLNSAICTPAPGAQLSAGRQRIAGYAIDYEPVAAVELSVDGGRRWREAALLGEGQRWSWSFWEREVRLPAGRHELVVRAWDQAGNTQPATVAEIWNFKGYFNNSWQRRLVEVV
ncbi:MAG: sulfite oxidase [Anaerolineaceae bacterium]|nr:sulfite oxidase [Anaerolineaceae bacterium]